MLDRGKVLVVLVVALGAVGRVSAQVREESIAPSTTEPAITQWNSPHWAMLDAGVPSRGLLFVYMHGQGGAAGGARDLMRTAADEGFYTVGVTYPNDWTPFAFCSGADSACYENLRREILDGQDRSPFVAVNEVNAFEHRLRRLLEHLHAAHPAEAWGEFLDGETPRWERIVLWGHSQGGANAAVLARHHVVAGVITSAPATDFVGGQPAAWWAAHATPTARYAGFCHNQDQLSAKVAAWNAIGIGVYGPPVDVATNLPPYGATRELSSSVAPAVAGQYHNSVVADSVTPRLTDGTPVYAAAWRYLMNAVADRPCDGDVNCDFALDGFDVEAQENAVGGDTTDYCQPDPDFNGDFALDGFDVEAIEIVVGGGACP